jgi:Tol biopolymer transport system component
MRSGNRDIFTVDADGTGLQQRTSGSAEELDADWSPDGSTLAFAVLGSSSQTQGMATLRLADSTGPEFVAIPRVRLLPLDPGWTLRPLPFGARLPSPPPRHR